MEALVKIVNFLSVFISIMAFYAMLIQAKLRVDASNVIDIKYRQGVTLKYLAMFLVFGVLAVITA